MKKKLFTSTIGKLLVIVTVLMNVFVCSVSAKNVSVGVHLDKTFNSTISASNADITSASYAFTNKWGITLVPTSMWATTGGSIAPINLCTASAASNCSCGSVCINATTSNIHHKNIWKNYYSLTGNYPTIGWGLLMGRSSSPMCGVWNSTHGYGYGGVGGVKAKYTYVTNVFSAIVNIRIIQHELSHNFGCYDNGSGSNCTPGNMCIMRGSYDNIPITQTPYIWCANCVKYFDVNAH